MPDCLRRCIRLLTTTTELFAPKKRPPNWGKNRQRKQEEVRIKRLYQMATDEVLKTLEPLRCSVKERGDFVRQLKEQKAPEADVKKAVFELKKAKKILEDKELSLAPKSSFDRSQLETLLKQRFFYDQSFSIYGGVTGFFDFGPVGCAMKANLLAAWRNFFVVEEGMLEVESAMMTPEQVLKASGHVDKFADFMVKDTSTGECFRADHLVEAHLEKMLNNKHSSNSEKDDIRSLMPKLDALEKVELDAVIKKYGVKSPLTGNDVSEALEFNLMFDSTIGPTGSLKGYLRPETAQGIFVNFKRLLEFNQGRLPFAASQIGYAFRNEISPRSGLLRVREFPMAEIEHFYDPDETEHPKFKSIAQTKVNMWSGCDQLDGKSHVSVTIGDALESGIISNQVLGYFLARIFLFMVQVGVNPEKLRFRQHLSNEMAHYAKDCWDAECLTSYGWVECVGCADRSCFDLHQHTITTGVKLTAEKKLAEPKVVSVVECLPNKGLVGKTFKKDAKLVNHHLASLSADQVDELERKINSDGEVVEQIDNRDFTFSKEMLTFKRYDKNVHVEDIMPTVVEPSFGIGRIMYTILEHNFRIREGDEARTYVALPPIVAPYKCSILPLSSSKPVFEPFVKQISDDLRQYGVMHKVDDSSGSIGRRYARTDQIAIPFGITVDFDTLKDPHTATLRERDSMKQIRAPIGDMARLVHGLSNGLMVWGNVLEQYPLFEQQEAISA